MSCRVSSLGSLCLVLAFVVASALATTASAASSLTTSFADDNGQDGIMFDIVVGSNPLTITSFDLNLDRSGRIANLELYTRPGTHVGFQQTSAGWTLFDSINVVSNGDGNATPADFADFVAPANATTAIYLTALRSSTSDFNYIDGTAVGNVAASNADLSILEGTGKAYAFSSNFTPRVFSGTVNYTVGQVGPDPQAIPEPVTATLSVLAMASLGLVATRRPGRTE